MTTRADIIPKIMVRWSDNGGKTWSTERTLELGRQGEYTKRAVLRRLGTGNAIGRTFNFRISAAVAKALQGASVDVEKLPP